MKNEIPNGGNLPYNTLDCVLKLFAKLDSTKATGIDGIAPKILTKCSDLIDPHINLYTEYWKWKTFYK